MEKQQTLNNQIKYLVVYLIGGQTDIYRVEYLERSTKTFYSTLLVMNGKLDWHYAVRSEEHIWNLYAIRSTQNINFLVNKSKKFADIQDLIQELSSSKAKRKKNKEIINFLCNQEI